MDTNKQPTLILTTAQAQAVYSAMCALNNLGRVGGSVIIPKEPDQSDEPRVSWNFLGVTVHQDLTFHKEYYADQSAFAAAYGLPVAAQGLVAALRVAYSDIQRLPGHTIDMLGRIEAAIEQAVA